MALASLVALSASGAEAGADTGGNLPQLNIETFPSQIFWLLVTLVILYYLLSKIALPRIASVLEERADTIADDLDKADEFKRKAQEAEAAYEQALADARSKAMGIAAETRDAIQTQVNEAMAKADAEIAARTAEGEKRIGEIRESAKIAVQEVAEETSVAVVEAVLPDVVDAAALKAAVASRMEG